MTEVARGNQTAVGSFIAQAVDGGIAVVNVYQQAAAAPVSKAEQADAEARLAELPVATVAAPAALPPKSRMLFARNALFVGREEHLKTLADALKSGETAAVGQIAAATGLGGIGKTQLANEFAHRYGQYFAGGVFWLNFADADAIPGEIASCGGVGALDLRPDFGNLSLHDQVRLVAAAWHGSLPRLLIFDNCEDEDLLAQWRPSTGGCRVMVTSRRAEWSKDLGVHTLPLGVLSRRESIDLLRSHRPELPADDPDLAAIAEELGDLPLALHLAGSFLWSYRYVDAGTPTAYLAELRRADLLAHRSMTVGGRSPTGHEQHVARTFALSYDRLDNADFIDAVASSLLVRAACFAAGEPIPRDLLRASLDVAEDDPEAALRTEDAIARLVALGLVEQDDHGALVLHRLLSLFVRGATGEPELTSARIAVETAVLAEATRLNMAGYPGPLLAWQPHLRAAAASADAAGSERTAGLYSALGYHLRMVADYRGASAAYERALAIANAFGLNHDDVASCVNNLGGVQQDLGDFEGARASHERALAIIEKAYGPSHPTVAACVNNVGSDLQHLGDLKGARTAYERALAIVDKAFGSDHPEAATYVDNLGRVLQALGDFEGARAAFERALAIDEKAFGPDHPNIAVRANNLGGVLRDLGDLKGARAAHERALAIDEKAFGSEHPNVGICVDNPGSVLHDLGDLKGARAAHERALAIDEKAFGSEHPKVANDINNLGGVLRDLGDLKGARAAFERALAIDEKAFAPDHPNVAVRVSNLGTVLLALGDLKGSRAAIERALAIDEKAFGPDHPNVAIRLNNLGGVLQDLGDLEGARAAFGQALAIDEKALGPDHPNVAIRLNNLGRVLRALGDLERARTTYERAPRIFQRAFGAGHESTRIVWDNLKALRDSC